MPDIGVPELLIVLVVILLIFGSSRLPKLARSLGQAKQAFEEALGRHPPRGESWLDVIPRVEDRVSSVDAIRPVYRFDHEKAHSR
jgi:TatA/E family protein of Tat protein translocase